MEFKDYYAALMVEPTATDSEVKRSYRRLARKFHPDVSREPDAEARFKEVAEAYKVLKDPEKRAAYDAVARRYHQGERFDPPPGWDRGFEFRGSGAGDTSNDGPGPGEDMSEFFASLFGRARHAAQARRGGSGGESSAGTDRHARISIDLVDAYRGGKRMVSLQEPRIDEQGHVAWKERQLEIDIPAGVRSGQSLRLAGQGDPGSIPGDLYLEVEIRPDPVFRVEGKDVYFDLPVSPWEAALGAQVVAPTPDGPVELGVPPGSPAGRRLRLKGRGIPGAPAGDLYARLSLVLPPADSEPARQAWTALARAFPGFAPRGAPEA